MPLVDTWTWVEYFQGSRTGAQIQSIVEGPDVCTSVLTLAELSDVYEREGRPGLDDRIAFIRGRGPILGISHRATRLAGATKWRQRKEGHPLGLADALIYETARENRLEVVTGDEGLRGLPGVRFIETKPR